MLMLTGFAGDAVLLFKFGTVHWVDPQHFTAVWFGLADSLFIAGFHGCLMGPRHAKKFLCAGHGGRFCLQSVDVL